MWLLVCYGSGVSNWCVVLMICFDSDVIVGDCMVYVC